VKKWHQFLGDYNLNKEISEKWVSKTRFRDFHVIRCGGFRHPKKLDQKVVQNLRGFWDLLKKNLRSCLFKMHLQVIFETLKNFKNESKNYWKIFIENMKNLMRFFIFVRCHLVWNHNPQTWIAIWASQVPVKTSIPRSRGPKIDFNHQNQKYRKWCIES